MELKCFNIKPSDLEQDKRPFFIGISVGVKPLNTQSAIDYLKWAYDHSSKRVQILIADEIARYNYLAFSHYTKSGALSRAIRDGDSYQKFFEGIFSSHLTSLQSHFNILRWKDIKTARFYQIFEALKGEFTNNKRFQECIFFILDQYIERRKKQLTSDKRFFLGSYLLEELAVLLDGIYYEESYKAILYPTYRFSGMSQLVSRIQHGEELPGLAEKLNLQPTAMVEFMIPEH